MNYQDSKSQIETFSARQEPFLQEEDLFFKYLRHPTNNQSSNTSLASISSNLHHAQNPKEFKRLFQPLSTELNEEWQKEEPRVFNYKPLLILPTEEGAKQGFNLIMKGAEFSEVVSQKERRTQNNSEQKGNQYPSESYISGREDRSECQNDSSFQGKFKQTIQMLKAERKTPTKTLPAQIIKRNHQRTKSSEPVVISPKVPLLRLEQGYQYLKDLNKTMDAQERRRKSLSVKIIKKNIYKRQDKALLNPSQVREYVQNKYQTVVNYEEPYEIQMREVAQKVVEKEVRECAIQTEEFIGNWQQAQTQFNPVLLSSNPSSQTLKTARLKKCCDVGKNQRSSQEFTMQQQWEKGSSFRGQRIVTNEKENFRKCLQDHANKFNNTCNETMDLIRQMKSVKVKVETNTISSGKSQGAQALKQNVDSQIDRILALIHQN